jgi:hypothetical protein
MVDVIIDTNVLLVASAGDPDSPFTETHRSIEECTHVLEWLIAFGESESSLVLDQDNRIYDEYHNKLQWGDLGLRVIYAKLSNSRFRQQVIEFESDGSALVPETFAALDRSDRKFLAVALVDRASGNDSEIVNATDSDWRQIEGACAEHGIVVRHLLD